MLPKILYGLHRPFHQPIWIVKWVCAFFVQRKERSRGFFYCKETLADFYFVMLDWLDESYPSQYKNGIPSKEAIFAVRREFASVKDENKFDYLKWVLQKKRTTKIEKQIYSTYKAAGYYINLAKDKLHLIDEFDNICIGNFPSRYWKTSKLNREEKYVILKHILNYDACCFISLCLLQKEAIKYDLPLSALLYDYLGKFYPSARFDFISKSQHNYYVVRNSWIEILGIKTQTGTLSLMMKKAIEDDSITIQIYQNILSYIEEYKPQMRHQKAFKELSVLFDKTYAILIKKQDKINDYVSLYAISTLMGMGYKRFNSFLSEYYEHFRSKKNIFFENIVNTIDQRKRFYVRDTPVLSIKITNL